MIDDPIGFFLTWNTYGTWLPGDQRGWVEYHHGWKFPDPVLEFECRARMTEDACILSMDQRNAVAAQIEETCRIRGWQMHVVNPRSNHVHVVLTAFEDPKKIRIDLKAWAMRVLKRRFDSKRENWWADRGSIRHLFDEKSLEAAILYVSDAQDQKSNPIPTVTHLPL